MLREPANRRVGMPTFETAPGVHLHYLVDDFTEPWREAATIVLLHGNAESGQAWYAWVPLLARRFRVVRPDMRGYGASTPMPRDFKWSLDVIIDDYRHLLDALGVRRFHLVGAKIGGIVARAFAAGRLGDRFPAEGVEWWIKFMGRTPVSTIVGFNAAINYSDIRADLPKIVCPTLVITTDESGLASVEETRAWQQTIKNSELLVVPGNSFHVAASDAERCARATLDFVDRHGGAT